MADEQNQTPDDNGITDEDIDNAVENWGNVGWTLVDNNDVSDDLVCDGYDPNIMIGTKPYNKDGNELFHANETSFLRFLGTKWKTRSGKRRGGSMSQEQKAEGLGGVLQEDQFNSKRIKFFNKTNYPGYRGGMYSEEPNNFAWESNSDALGVCERCGVAAKKTSLLQIHTPDYQDLINYLPEVPKSEASLVQGRFVHKRESKCIPIISPVVWYKRNITAEQVRHIGGKERDNIIK
jgi:hypothetical protein